MRLEFHFGEEFGLKTAIAQSPSLDTWNGYVGLPLGHPLHGVEEDGLYDLADVHGGITWVNCHLPTMQPDGYWWLGFDTAHAGDLVPGMDMLPDDVKERISKMARELVAALFDMNPEDLDDTPMEEEYRDAEYVAAEVSYLASQLAVVSMFKE